MKDTSRRLFLAALPAAAILFMLSDASAATVIKLKSQGVAIADIQNFKLSDGSTVQVVTNRYVFTEIEGSDLVGKGMQNLLQRAPPPS